MPHFSVLLLLLLLCAACTSAEVADPTATDVLTPTVALDLSLGDDDSVLVGALQDATRFPDGRLALLDADRGAVLLLDSTGHTLGVIGRRGSGPGEFQLPLWVGRCQADSLYVWDRGLARVSIFSTSGTYVREMRPAVTAPFQPECLPDGRFVTLDASQAAGAPAAADGQAALIYGALVFMSPDGEALSFAPGLVLGEAKIFGRFGAMALLGDHVAVGLNSSNQLRHFGFDGTALGLDTLAAPLLPLDDARFEAMIERQAASTGGDSAMRAMLRGMLVAEGKPEHAPLFSSMHGAPDGTVWWVTSLNVDSTTTLVGFRPGAPTRTMTLPAGVEVLEVGADYLLGRRTDAEGRERLLLWRW